MPRASSWRVAKFDTLRLRLIGRLHLTPAAPDGEPDPLRPWEIELPAWLYNAILRRRDILAVHPD